MPSSRTISLLAGILVATYAAFLAAAPPDSPAPGLEFVDPARQVEAVPGAAAPPHPPLDDGAPRRGDLAPDFTLKTIDGAREVTLSQFRGRQPVVLIFGSWT